VLYLLRLLMEKVKEIEFDAAGTTLATIQLHILDALCCCAQDTYPYHLPNVVSNDQLYGADPKFINEINELASTIVEQLLMTLKTLADKPRLQCSLGLELFERVATKSDLQDEKLFTLAVNLWNLTIKSRNMAADPKAHHKVVRHLETATSVARNKSYQRKLDELVNRIRSKL